MHFLYLDESGKDLYTDPQNKGIYIFGGIVVNKNNVHDTLNNFKPIYQKFRRKVKEEVQNQLGEANHNDATKVMFNFEFHATEIFKTKRDQSNPWSYFDPQNKFRMVYELIDTVIDSVECVYIFEINKNELNDYRNGKGLSEPDKKHEKRQLDKELDKEIIKMVVDTFNQFLIETGTKGSIIPDRLNSDIRENFVSYMKNNPSDLCWSEPILVDSNLNAFTQLVDIITYVYLKYRTLDPTSKKTKVQDFHRAMNRTYKQRIEPKAVIVNLVDIYNEIDKKKSENE
jgi:hypothetical protein